MMYIAHGVEKVLENFTLYEARCHGVDHDCGVIILDPELLSCLDRVRVKYGMPIIVNSWTRCREHNAAVGGAAQSYHMNGRAADLTATAGGDMMTLRRICRAVFPFAIDYENYIHCDVRGPRP